MAIRAFPASIQSGLNTIMKTTCAGQDLGKHRTFVVLGGNFPTLKPKQQPSVKLNPEQGGLVVRFNSLFLFLAVAVFGISAVEGQRWVPFEGSMPAHAFTPTRENPEAGAICRMTGPPDVSPKHLLGSVQEERGELVCRGATYSGDEYKRGNGRRIIADPQFDVLVLADLRSVAQQAAAGVAPQEQGDAASQCPWETHYNGHLFCEGSVNWENLKPKVGVQEIWQGLLCVRALEDCGERGGNGSVVCRKWDEK
jgi:hypothetical protein